MDELLVERDGNVEVITLNRPEMLNALTSGMVKGLGDLFEEAQADDSIRAVLLTGAGKAFSTGADLTGKGSARNDAHTALGMRISTFGYSRMVSSIWALEKPVVCAVNGTAAGASCNLALSCDMVLAADSAKFIQVFVRRGLIPDGGGTYFLPRLVGLPKAKELMFLGEDLRAEKALELGLIYKVVPAEKLMEKAMELAQRLANGPTRAIGMIKSMLNKSFDSDIMTALEREASLQGIAASTSDFIEGVTSFLQKRPPEFKGK
ncbi:MAG: enoyl-CoA hydratase-related protein [Desulfosudis oleivorans]|nr:enoyl-CoA hydratase-related protein [Desulfosudis oleivorans]